MSDVKSLCKALSDWEVIEAYVEHTRYGTPLEALAGRYGVSKQTIKRTFRLIRHYKETQDEKRR